MSVEKLPSNSDPRYQPSTNTVRPDVGKSAAEGKAAGDRGNAAFKGGMNPGPRPIPKP